jgi:CubicO group peptidase (beta-lactamase class C family)
MLPEHRHRTARHVGLALMLSLMLGLPLLCWSGVINAPSAASAPSPSGNRIEACLAPVAASAMPELQVPGAIIGVWMPGEEPWTAAGMVSTLGDLQRYAGTLATGQLVSQKSQAERLRWIDVGTRPRGIQYGFTIADFGGGIGHNGKIAGFQSFMGYIPANDVTIIMLTNLFAAAGDKGPADELAKRILSALQTPMSH